MGGKHAPFPVINWLDRSDPRLTREVVTGSVESRLHSELLREFGRRLAYPSMRRVMNASSHLRISAVVSAILATGAYAEQLTPLWRPNATFVQGGGRHVRSATAGVIWDWRWEYESPIGPVTGYTEAAIGTWRTYSRATDKSFGHLSATPVLRLYPHAWRSGWFIEAGIGANVITPKYQNDARVFSTAFNFGDHLGIGWRFGVRQSGELALRFERFSNAHIKAPNPGENFLQVRYALQF